MSRLQILEIAETRPFDIENFYTKHTRTVNGCRFLNDDAPKYIGLLFRGKLKHYLSREVPFLLADRSPDSPRSCGNAECINPNHVI